VNIFKIIIPSKNNIAGPPISSTPIDVRFFSPPDIPFISVLPTLKYIDLKLFN
jgi:hypothetical protein